MYSLGYNKLYFTLANQSGTQPPPSPGKLSQWGSRVGGQELSIPLPQKQLATLFVTLIQVHLSIVIFPSKKMGWDRRLFYYMFLC